MKRYLIALLLLVLMAAALAAAALGARHLIRTRPRAKRRTVETKPTLVEVMIVKREPVRVTVHAMGTVVPARTLSLRAQVTGRVIEQNPKLVAGGIIQQGELVVRLDPRDYELAIEQQKGHIERAQYELDVEKGRHVVAKREWDLLKAGVPNTPEGRALALREPHLRNAKAALAAAGSTLQLAELNLSRTVIKAPFNVLVREEFVDVGELVTPQAPIADLVGTDTYWVQAAVPVNRLDYISIPGINGSTGAAARVLHETSRDCTIECRGRVIRLLADLEPVGRMARVLIQVDDPMRLKAKKGLPLLLDAYVRVEIDGRTIKDVVVIPRMALQEDNQVWIMDGNDQLEARRVDIVWRRESTVVVGKGLKKGERVVISPVPSPLPGMKLRTADSAEPTSSAHAGKET